MTQRLLTQLRRFCLSLPDGVEADSWGHPNFRAGKRTFAVYELYKGRPCITVKLPPPEGERLLADARFFRTPYIGKQGWGQPLGRRARALDDSAGARAPELPRGGDAGAGRAPGAAATQGLKSASRPGKGCYRAAFIPSLDRAPGRGGRLAPSLCFEREHR